MSKPIFYTTTPNAGYGFTVGTTYEARDGVRYRITRIRPDGRIRLITGGHVQQYAVFGRRNDGRTQRLIDWLHNRSVSSR